MISAVAVQRPPVYDRARAVAHYDGQMRSLIHDFKFRDTQDARRLFGRWLTTSGRDLLTDANLIVPVPLYRLRLLSRRFNQSVMLAREVGRLTGIAADPFTLVRTRRTRQQVGLTMNQRQQNVRGAFSVVGKRRQSIAGRKIVLIDDVVTTGAAVEACSKALKDAGAARVTSSEVVEQ